MKPTEKIEKLLKNMNVTPAPNKDRQMLNAILQAQVDTNKQTPATIKPGRWSTIMKNPITKYAAAAMLFIAVIFGVNLIPGTKGPVALASIIETFKNATCISYDMKLGEDSPLIHDTIYNNIIRRKALGSTTIIDLDNKKFMSLMHSEKKAVEMGIDGLPELPQNYIDHLVNILSTMQQKEDVTSEDLEPREVDGQKQFGYFFESNKHNIQVEIWMDPETSLPTAITATRPGLKVIMENFNFDENVDPALFEMTPPEGYTLMNMQGMFDFEKDDNEETFIEGLRTQAILYDGWFPQDVSIESYIKRAQDIGGLVEEKFEGTMAQMQAGMKLGKGLIFLRFWKGQGPWHYAGNGVKLGQADEPIFWYQPKDSDVFRVIFGDLHVEEISPEDIDALVADRVALSGFGYQLWDKNEFLTLQEDELYVKADNIIEMHSKIDIRKGPMNLSRIQLALPYENAELISATFGDTVLPYEQDNTGQYFFYPDGEKIVTGENIITLIWQFPLENLKQTDYGYTVPLQSFLPSTFYRITAILDTNCGYIWNKSAEDLEKARKRMPTREPDNPRMLTLFTIGKPNGNTTFGTCGLCIKPE